MVEAVGIVIGSFIVLFFAGIALAGLGTAIAGTLFLIMSAIRLVFPHDRS